MSGGRKAGSVSSTQPRALSMAAASLRRPFLPFAGVLFSIACTTAQAVMRGAGPQLERLL